MKKFIGVGNDLKQLEKWMCGLREVYRVRHRPDLQFTVWLFLRWYFDDDMLSSGETPPEKAQRS
jgi:hypothetical protein